MILLKLNRRLTLNIRPLSLNTPHYHFRPTPQFQLYDKYLKDTNTKANIHQSSSFKFQRVVVPRHLQDYQEIKNKLAGQWKGKKLVFDVDSSALIGGKRLTMKSYLEETVLKGQTTPDPLFCQINPAAQLNIQELAFDEQVFFLSDPAVVEFLKQKADLPEDEQQILLQQFLANFYEANPHRMIHRLGSVLNVPQPYRELIQLGVLNFNQIYFCGINQFALRNLLSKAIKLREVRQLFMLSLKYALVQSYQWRLRNPPLAQQQNGENKSGFGSGDKLENRYQIYARELLYLNYYHIIKKIENGELLKRISLITKDKTKNPDQSGRAVKRRRNAGQNKEQSSGVVLFAHSYSLDSLPDYILIKDLEIFNPVQNKPKISTANLNSPSTGSKVEVKKSSQSDAQKIEKHAILQVMLGSLWNKPYTFNKFPYLSQNYMKLSQADKDQVNQLYRDFVTKYTGAKRLYYQQNIQIFQHQNLANLSVDIDKFRVSYDQARKQYEDGMEFIRKKTEQRQKQKQKGEKKKKKTKKEVPEDQIKQQTHKKQFAYKESYEQDPIQLQRLIDELKTNPSSKPKAETSKQSSASSSSPLSMGFQQKIAIKNIESETGQKTEGQLKRGRSVLRRKTAQAETGAQQKPK